MPKPAKNLSFKILTLLLRPVVRFCLRHSLRLQDLIESSKSAFVEIGKEELRSSAKKSNISRLSVMSGVHRRDVMRLLNQKSEPHYEKDLITKVIGRWQTDEKYITSRGEPRILSYGSDDSEFCALVHSVSKDLNPGTVLFELERVAAVEVTARGLKLLIESYVPKGDPLAGFNILSHDSEDLVSVVEENIFSDPDLPQFHARTVYDNVHPDALDELKRWFLKEGHEFHARVRQKVSQLDQDINPDSKFKGKGLKVVFSSFSAVKKEEK